MVKNWFRTQSYTLSYMQSKKTFVIGRKLAEQGEWFDTEDNITYARCRSAIS